MIESRQIRDLHVDLQKVAINFLSHCACQIEHATVFIDATFRDNEKQDYDYATGRTRPGKIITHARAGESPHNFQLADGTYAALAFDIAIRNPSGITLDWEDGDESWFMAHSIGRSLNLTLGEDWPKLKKDPPHFEIANWLNYKGFS